MEYQFRNGVPFSITQEKVFQDFDLFTRAMIVSGDDDPTYPMIATISEMYGFEPFWFAFMYHAFYSLESAIEVCRKMPTLEDWNVRTFSDMRKAKNMKFGYERRGLRDVFTQVNHLNAVVEFIPTIAEHLQDNLTYRKAVESLPQNGPWAGFKNAEIMEKSFGIESLSIPDIGIAHRDPNSDNDGPVPALRLMYGWDFEYDRSILPVWDRFGCNLAEAYGVSIGKVETCLCKFIKPFKGKYFIGHDIFEFHELIEVMGRDDWKKAMKSNFDRMFWDKDVSSTQIKKWNKEYQFSGVLMNDHFAAKHEPIDVCEVLLQTR